MELQEHLVLLEKAVNTLTEEAQNQSNEHGEL